MNVPSLQPSIPGSVISQPNQPFKSDDSSQNPSGTLFDSVALSDSGRQLVDSYLSRQSTPPTFVAIPADQRPTAQQSADVILGFVGQQLQKRAAEGATEEELDKLFNQAVKGFEQGLAEAMDIIEGLGVMTEDIQASIAQTQSLVLEGLDALRETYLGGTANNVPAQEVSSGGVVTQVTAFAERSVSSAVSSSRVGTTEVGSGTSVQAASAAYAQSYRDNGSVELAVKTQDGDLVTLSFSSSFSSNRSVAAFVSNSGQGSVAAQAYQSSLSVNSSFSLSVQGDLDEGELDALNSLLEQVAELSDEFFNGDFDAAVALASEFEMDAGEFSAMSLDIARSTSASMVQSVAGVEGAGAQESAIIPVSTADILGQVLDQLKAAEQLAQSFSDSDSLLTDLLGNRLAQQSQLAPAFDGGAVARLLDGLLGSLS